jgi:hypothetical protein
VRRCDRSKWIGGTALGTVPKEAGPAAGVRPSNSQTLLLPGNSLWKRSRQRLDYETPFGVARANDLRRPKACGKNENPDRMPHP